MNVEQLIAALSELPPYYPVVLAVDVTRPSIIAEEGTYTDEVREPVTEASLHVSSYGYGAAVVIR